MKFALLILAILPMAFAANVPEKRLLESLLGGYDSKFTFTSGAAYATLTPKGLFWKTTSCT